MKTRIIHTRFWNDNYIVNLSHKEKITFIYLLTNEKVSISGIYELPDKNIKADLDLTQGELDKIKTKLQKDNRFHFYNGWIKIVRVEKYNSYLGEKNSIAKNKELSIAPKEMLNIGMGSGINTSIDTSIDTLNNQKSEIRNHKLEKERGYRREDLTEEILQEIADKYQVPTSFVKSKLDDLDNYVQAHGKPYKNYKAALSNFVKSDALKIKQAQYGQSKIGFINPK
jgi:hypothetical protein